MGQSRLSKVLERLFVRDAVGAPRIELSKQLTAIETKNTEYPIYLRFSHRGDTAYQRLTVQEIRGLLPLLEKYATKENT